MIKPNVTRLSDVSTGEFVCCGIEESDNSHTRMKSLGICEGRALELVSTGDPLIVRVGGSRIGLSRVLAQSVSVSETGGERKPK